FFMAKYVHGLLLFPAAFAALVLSKAYSVSKAALVPAVVESDAELVRANSKLTVGGALIGLVAAAPGVAILKLFNARAVLWAAAGLAAFEITGRPAAALLATVVGLGSGVGKLAFDSLVQRDAADAARGRSFARFEAGFQLAWVVGALIPVIVTMSDRIGFLVL